MATARFRWERRSSFAIYPPEARMEIVGDSTCGGCPGGDGEYVPEEMKKNGAEVIHLATCRVVGYPPCPNLEPFKHYIEAA